MKVIGVPREEARPVVRTADQMCMCVGTHHHHRHHYQIRTVSVQQAFFGCLLCTPCVCHQDPEKSSLLLKFLSGSAVLDIRDS